MEAYEAFLAFLFSTVKLMVMPITLAATGKFPIHEVAFYCGLGGMVSAISFFFLGKKMDEFFKKKKKKSQAKKIFSRKNILIVKVKNKFGLFGIAMTIGLISVPLGAIITGKYFGKHKMAIPTLIGCAFLWSFAMSYGTALVKNVIEPLWS